MVLVWETEDKDRTKRKLSKRRKDTFSTHTTKDKKREVSKKKKKKIDNPVWPKTKTLSSQRRESFTRRFGQGWVNLKDTPAGC